MPTPSIPLPAPARALIASRNPLIQALLLTPPQPPPPAQRFIILVPDHPLQETQLVRAVWELAHPRQTSLLFITLVTDEAQTWRARRRLATLAALARNTHNVVDIQLITGNWLSGVHALWQPGDLVLCHAEQTISHWGQHHTLAEALITRYRMPIYLLTGFCSALDQPPASPWMRGIIFDVMAAVVLVVFFLFQIELQHIEPLWLRQVLIGGSVLLECGALAFGHAYMFPYDKPDA